MNYKVDEKYTISIDPGLRFAAYTVFNSEGKIRHTETIKFNTKLSQPVRLQILYSSLVAAAEKYPPENILTEYQFVDIMSSIVGVIMAFSGLYPDAVFNKTTPSSWKKSVTGKGNIEEEKLKEILLKIYPEAKDYDEHQLDTLGIYLAYKEKQKEIKDDVLKGTRKSNKKKKSG